MSDLEVNPEIFKAQLMPGLTLHIIADPNSGVEATEGTETVIRAAMVMAGALQTIAAKTVHYGGAWQKQGWMGNFARIMSKVSRLQNMVWRDLAMEDATETVVDTVQDLINLAVFFTLNRQAGNRWGS